MNDTLRDLSRLRPVFLVVVLGAVVLFDTRAQTPAKTRPASKAEIRSLCQAIARQQEVAHLDQAVDLNACLNGAMIVRTGGAGPEVSGRVTINFPGYTLAETCRASLRAGQVDPKTVDCR